MHLSHSNSYKINVNYFMPAFTFIYAASSDEMCKRMY